MYKLVLMMAVSSTGADLPIPYSGPGSCWGGPGCYGWSNCFAGRACTGSGSYSAFNTYAPTAGAVGYGCRGCVGTMSASQTATVTPSPARLQQPVGPKQPEELHGPKETAAANQAIIVVILPPGARLTFDGQPTSQASATRRFVTPPLPRGKTLYYLLKAEIADGGLQRVLTEQIEVRPGEETRVLVDFTKNQVALGR